MNNKNILSVRAGVLAATTLIAPGCATQQVGHAVQPSGAGTAGRAVAAVNRTGPVEPGSSIGRLSRKDLRTAVKRAEQEAYTAIREREKAVAAADQEAIAAAKALIEDVDHDRGPIRRTIAWTCDKFYLVTGIAADCSMTYGLQFIEKAPAFATSVAAANRRQVDAGARLLTNGVACGLGYLTGAPAPGAAIGGVFNLGANLLDNAKEQHPYTLQEGVWDFISGAGSGALCGFAAQNQEIDFRHNMNAADRYVIRLHETNIANEAAAYREGIDIAIFTEYTTPTPVPPPPPVTISTPTPIQNPGIPTPTPP
jgi:hypothetical protein